MKPTDENWPRCACGCGEPVPVRKCSNPSRGTKKGEPCKYVAGHVSRVLTKAHRDGKKECCTCKEWKLPEEFSKNRKRPDGLEPRCKACTSVYHRKWNQENREKRTQKAREFRAKNPDYQRQNVARWRANNYEHHLAQSRIYAAGRRARIRNQFVEHIDAFVVYERDRGMCALCDKPVSRDDFHVDHDVPLAKGGLHAYLNVQLAHPICNMRKHDRITL